MEAYSPSRKKRKDPNAPKQPLSAYFIFQTEIRDQIKSELQNPTIYDVAKEVGRRWADMAPEVKQRYAHMAEMGRRKYDQEMAVYMKEKNQMMSEEDRRAYEHRLTSIHLHQATQGNNSIGGGIDPMTANPMTSTVTPMTSAMTSVVTARKSEAPAANQVGYYTVLEGAPGARAGEMVKEER